MQAEAEASRKYARELAVYVKERAKANLEGLRVKREQQLEESARLREVILEQQFHCGSRF